MNPEQRAEDIFGKFYNLPMKHEMAKDCALIAVKEILNLYSYLSDHYEYWQEVKNEIENF